MYLLGNKWHDGFLDYPCEEGRVRIRVQAWMVLSPVSEIYIKRPRSMRLIWEYVREIGLVSTVQKICSRMNESLRNERYFSIGLGRIESDASNSWPEGTAVAFVAPSHPRCVERIVLPHVLVKQIDEQVIVNVENPKGIVWYEKKDDALILEELCGWQPESGNHVSEDSVKRFIDSGVGLWNKFKSTAATVLPLEQPTPVRERTTLDKQTHSEKGTCKTPRAVLFGLGNYAKTVIMGSIDSRIRIECVHEMDPTQIGRIDKKQPWLFDTSPSVRSTERYDVYFIAGYHHTHADLTIAALERNAYAIVEKPLVTNAEQLKRLTQTLQQTENKLFACFHMRYNPLFQLAKQDLGVAPGEPIHSYCTVFEVPLPQRHWYRWPNSCSHLVSNGCHWLDHFLYMNDYSKPIEWRVWKSGNGDSQVGVELENGAVLGMFLTHAGSSRIGVQDHVELRANGRTVTVDCGSRYTAESASKILRRRRINKMLAYRTMYKTILRKIIAEQMGDTMESVLLTHELVLKLEDQRQNQ